MLTAEASLCGSIDTVRDVLYDAARPYVADSSSLFEGIVKAAILATAIEIDTALLRNLAGCPQPPPHWQATAIT